MVTALPLVTRNLVSNPSLETDATGMVTATSAGITLAGSRAALGGMYGSWAWLMNVTANSGGAAGYAYVSPHYFDFLPGVPGAADFAVLARYFLSSANVGWRLGVDWFDDGGSLVGTDVTPITYPAGTGTVDVAFATASPAAAVKARAFFHVVMKNAGGTGFAYVDGMALQYGPGRASYLDGSRPGGVWEGAAHASQSVRVHALRGVLSGKRDSHLITISEAGDDAPVRLPTNGVDCSWRVNRRGELSAEIETARLRAAGLLRCRGYWVRFRVPGMGANGEWAGVIKKVRHDGDAGVTEVAAQSREALLDARRTAREYAIEVGDAGGLAAKMIADNAAEGSSFITEDRIGVTPLVSVQVRAEQLVEGIDQLARAADAEWRVTPANVFEFADRLGVDWGPLVTLLEGRDFTVRGWETLEDLDPVYTDLLALSGVQAYTRKTAVVVLNEALAEEIGQRQFTRVYPYMIKENQLRPTAKADLAQLGRLGRGITLDVRDTARRNWSRFAEGDTVRVRIPDAGVNAGLRIMVRTWSSTSNRVMVSGEWA